MLTLYLLGTNPALGSWLLAALLLAHGWVHLMFVFPRPAPAPVGEAAPSWDHLPRATDRNPTRRSDAACFTGGRCSATLGVGYYNLGQADATSAA